LKKWNLSYKFKFENRVVKYDVEGEGYPLVLVHGTPWSSFNMRHLIKGLCKSYKVYYFDLLGYGLSDKSDADVSLGIQNRLLDALIQHWNIESPLVIGHDFGGTTVLRNYILNKRCYKKVILIDPVALSPWGSSFFKHIEKNESAFAGVPSYIHKAIVRAYVKTAAYGKLDKSTLEGILEPWSSEAGQASFYRQIAQANSKFTDEFQEKFTEIEVPVLILWGEKDEWIPSSQGYSLQSKIKGSKLILIPSAGHLVIEEKPELLLESIKKFIED